MNKKFNILETIRQGQIGGGESHLLSLIENMDKNKYNPVVLSFTDGPMVDKLKENNIKVKVINSNKPFHLSKWNKVKSYIKENKIDLIHAHGGRAYSNVFWAGRTLGIPMIETVHGWSFNDAQPRLIKKIRLIGEKFLLKQSITNICVSESNRKTGKRYFKNFECPVIENGIDLQKFNPNRKFNNIRKELNVPNDITLITYIARFSKEKQPLVPLSTFATALKSNPSIRLLMVGDGDLKERALTVADKLKINKQVIFLPFRSDIPEILAASDIYLLTSLWEGLPIGLLEAMSMGKAIIASKVDGVVDIIQDGQNGMLIDLQNIEIEMPIAIIALSNNSALRNKLGENAKQTVNRHYSAQSMTKKIEDIYSYILND